MVKRKAFFEDISFYDLAKSSEKFVIRKHDNGLFTSDRWHLYLPDGTRYQLPSYKAALRIAISQIKKDRARERKTKDVYPSGIFKDDRPEARHPKLWQDRLTEVRATMPLPVADFVRVWGEGYLSGSSDMDNGIDTEDPRRARNPYRGIL